MEINFCPPLPKKCNVYYFMVPYKGTKRECICRRVAPDYAAHLSVPILDRGRKAKEREIGSSTMYCENV